MKPSFSKLFSNISRRKSSPSDSNEWGDLSSAEDGFAKPLGGRKLPIQDVSKFRDLSDKALKRKLRIINITIPPQRAMNVPATKTARATRQVR